MLLSILIPVYNERTVVERSLRLVLDAPLPENLEKELVIVDDCSTDGTTQILERLAASDDRIRLFRQEKNQGKGTAVRRARPDVDRRLSPDLNSKARAGLPPPPVAWLPNEAARRSLCGKSQHPCREPMPRMPVSPREKVWYLGSLLGRAFPGGFRRMYHNFRNS